MLNNKNICSKCFGFTLAELLIILGIIGIISAILLPNILKSKPDENKAMCMNCYNSLKKVLRPITNDRGTFKDRKDVISADGKTTHYDFRKAPLANSENGATMCRMIAEYMNANGASCRGEFQAYPGDGTENWNPSFTTTNGIQWFITTDNINLPDKKTYRTDVYIDVNGANGGNCIYSAACQNPDRFKFTILADGSLLPADPKSSVNVQTQHNWFKTKNDVDPNWNDVHIGEKIIQLGEEIIEDDDPDIPNVCAEQPCPPNQFFDKDDCECKDQEDDAFVMFYFQFSSKLPDYANTVLKKLNANSQVVLEFESGYGENQPWSSSKSNFYSKIRAAYAIDYKMDDISAVLLKRRPKTFYEFDVINANSPVTVSLTMPQMKYEFYPIYIGGIKQDINTDNVPISCTIPKGQSSCSMPSIEWKGDIPIDYFKNDSTKTETDFNVAAAALLDIMKFGSTLGSSLFFDGTDAPGNRNLSGTPNGSAFYKGDTAITTKGYKNIVLIPYNLITLSYPRQTEGCRIEQFESSKISSCLGFSRIHTPPGAYSAGNVVCKNWIDSDYTDVYNYSPYLGNTPWYTNLPLNVHY